MDGHPLFEVIEETEKRIPPSHRNFLGYGPQRMKTGRWAYCVYDAATGGPIEETWFKFRSRKDAVTAGQTALIRIARTDYGLNWSEMFYGY